jgi:Tol biopolymer transport system component
LKLRRILIVVLIVVLGISLIISFQFLLKEQQPKEYLLTAYKGKLYSISSDGRVITKLDEGVDGSIGCFSFSADGKKILFSYCPLDKRMATSLWVMNSDGSNMKKLFDGINGSVVNVCFSRDRRKILLLINDTLPNKGIQNVQSMDTYSFQISNDDGDNWTDLGFRMDAYLIYDISFSQDGKRFTFVRAASEERTFWIANSEGRIIRAGNADTGVSEVQFSFDGSKIFFLVEETKPQMSSSSWDLWVEDIGTTNKKKISGDINTTSFYISPDGNKIVFVALSSKNKYSLWIMNTDGTDKKKLTEEMIEIALPQFYGSPFSPSGSEILWNDSSLFALNLDNGKNTNLNKAFDMELSPAYTTWFPGNK